MRLSKLRKLGESPLSLRRDPSKKGTSRTLNNSLGIPGIQNLNESYNESDSQINNDIEASNLRHPSTRITQMDSEKPFIKNHATLHKQKHNLKVPDLGKLTGRGPNSILEGQPNICDARFEPM